MHYRFTIMHGMFSRQIEKHALVEKCTSFVICHTAKQTEIKIPKRYIHKKTSGFFQWHPTGRLICWRETDGHFRISPIAEYTAVITQLFIPCAPDTCHNIPDMDISRVHCLPMTWYIQNNACLFMWQAFPYRHPVPVLQYTAKLSDD